MFNKPSIYDHYSQLPAKIRAEIERQSDTYLLWVNPDEYVEYLVDSFGLPEIKFIEGQPPVVQHSRQKQKFKEFDEIIEREMIVIIVELPIENHPKNDQVLALRASTFSLSPPRFTYKRGWIITETGPSATGVERAISDIQKEVENRNSDIREHNANLRSQIAAMIQQRRDRIVHEKDLMESIIKQVGVPLQQRQDAASVIPTQVQYSKSIKAIAPPVASAPTEFVLEQDKFNAILNIIDNSGRQFERTPQTFAKLTEEELRDVILSNLNGVFDGSAVGEAFSKRGKTDIFLQVTKGGVFIAECKYWNGQQTLKDSIAQILGYLTWRNSYGVVILFSKRKGLSGVCETINSTIPTLDSYVKGLDRIAENHYKAIHHLPEDDRRLIEMHYVAYNLFCP